jgi:hypothetical protein
MYEFDELSIYRGSDIPITSKIIVKQPTLDQIEKFGEKRYFSSVHTLCAVGADLKWQLWEAGIDYTQIEDYDLFIRYICQVVSSRKKVHEELMNNQEKYSEQLSKLSKDDLDAMLINPLELVLNIDLGNFVPYEKVDNNQIVLYDKEHDITIDKFVYTRIINIVRQIHGFKRNNEKPANERTKMDLIEDARDEAMSNSRKPYKSLLKPLISFLSVKTGMCGDERIWNMPIGMFFDNIKRANKIQEAELLLQGAYSGFASLKGVDKSKLDMAGDI